MKTTIRGRPTRRRTVTKGRVGFVAVALIIATTAWVIHNLDSDPPRKPVVTALQASTQTVPSTPPKTRSALPGWNSPTKKDDDSGDSSSKSDDSKSSGSDDSGDSGSGKSDGGGSGGGKGKSKKSDKSDSSDSSGSTGSDGSSTQGSPATPLSETPSAGAASGTPGISGTGPKVQPGPVTGSTNTTPSTGTTNGGTTSAGTTDTGSTGTGNGTSTGTVPNNQVLTNPGGRATASVPVTPLGTTGSQMMPVQCLSVSQAQLPAAVAAAAPGTVFCLNEAPQTGTNLGTTTNGLPSTSTPALGSGTQVTPPAPLPSVSVPLVQAAPQVTVPQVTVPQPTQPSNFDSTSSSTGSTGSPTSLGSVGSSGAGGQCVNLSVVAELLHSIFGGGTTRTGPDGSTTVCGTDDGDGISTNTVNGKSVPPGVSTTNGQSDQQTDSSTSGSESSSGQSSSSSSTSDSDPASASGGSEQATSSTNRNGQTSGNGQISQAGPAGQGGGKPLKIWLTGYSFQDNTPPGSATVSHPIVHQKAGGTGTYADPITVASPGSSDNMAFKPGAKFYLPSVKRYVIVEDSGASPAPSGTDGHLDMWVDGQGGSKAASDACMNRITSNSATAIADPPPNEPVMAGPITSNGTCHIPGAGSDAQRRP
ncbi:hypothetical protein [Pseudonocardia spinosispora]|uniref:hypothetical protein n=1 Tax=Pseudonocardia spinosispora TaxID=103441 RepID=UPI000412B876|nr:hypothetical protein [Pseudonocardia spinosispora]